LKLDVYKGFPLPPFCLFKRAPFLSGSLNRDGNGYNLQLRYSNLGENVMNQPMSDINFDVLTPPKEGERIESKNGDLCVPDKPIIPIITGDGVGPDVVKVMKKVLDCTIEKAYGGRRKIVWFHFLPVRVLFESMANGFQRIH